MCRLGGFETLNYITYQEKLSKKSLPFPDTLTLIVLFDKSGMLT